MMSGIMKRVLAFAISLAMLTGSIPVNAEETVSGPSIQTVDAESIGIDTTKAQNNGEAILDDKGQAVEPSNNAIIEDDQTPTAPAPSTDGVGSGGAPGSVSDNNEKTTTVSGNEGNPSTVSGNLSEDTVSDNTLSDNSVSDNTLSGNTLSGNTLSDNQIEYITWSKTVDKVTITVSANKASVPEGTDLEVEQLDPVAMEVLENTIDQEEVKENIVVKVFKAFDISLVNNNETITPTEDVKVTFTGEILVDQKQKEDSITVYHLNEAAMKTVINDNGEKSDAAELVDMKGDLDGNALVMDTPHFSTYVIAVTSDATSPITLEYFLGTGEQDPEKTEIFSKDFMNLPVNTQAIQIPNKEGNDYILQKIVIKFQNGSSKILDDNDPDQIDDGLPTNFIPGGQGDTITVDLQGANITLTNGTKIQMYYRAKTENKVLDATFFDYFVGSSRTYPNINSYYINNGTYLGINYNNWGNSRSLMVRQPDGTPVNANVARDGGNPVKGIVSKLSSSSATSKYDKLVMGKNTGNNTIMEPGYFSNAPVTGKNIYNNFDLTFSKKGNEFDLQNVVNGSTVVAYVYKNNAVNDQFFPLDNVTGAEKFSNYYDGVRKSHNLYFGLRYDFEFSLGDYIGPLSYSFWGDDDVWVFMDGNLILDLGGIHGTYPNTSKLETGGDYPNTVNLWDAKDSSNNNILPNRTQLNDGDDTAVEITEKSKKHQITVLFMDRQATQSSCSMKFVVPNCESIDPGIIEKPTTDVTFTKVDDLGNTVQGAAFSLQKEGLSIVSTATSDSIGNVTFSGVTEGNYYLSETVTPSEYLKPSHNWLVEVKNSSGVLTYKIFDYSGSVKGSEVANKKIVNDRNLVYGVNTSKTTFLKDWDKRIYEVFLCGNLYAKDLNNNPVNLPENITETATIRDYIDSRFEVLIKSGLEYTVANDGDTVVAGNGGTGVFRANGNYIEWLTNGFEEGIHAIPSQPGDAATVTIPANETTYGWGSSFYIRAKANYLGGNDVPTNVPENSGITLNSKNTFFKFGEASPTVNVKVAFSLENLTDYLFLGDSTPTTVNTRLQNTISSNGLKYYGNDGVIGTQDDIIHTDTKDPVITWYKDANYTNIIYNIEGLTPKDDTTYYVKVSISPKTDGANSLAQSLNNKVSTIDVKKTYEVEIIKGKIIVKKIITPGDMKQFQGDAIFGFKLTGTNGNIFYKYVRFEREGDTSPKTVVFDNLPKDTYVLSELDSIWYAKKAISAVGFANGNIYSFNTMNSTASYKMELPTLVGGAIDKTKLDSIKASEKRLEGKATYTNTRTGKSFNRYSDSDVVVNTISPTGPPSDSYLTIGKSEH